MPTHPATVDCAELLVAVDAARQAGEIVANYFRTGVVMRHKRPHDLVSDADVEAEQAIVAAIRRVYPRHEVLGEEGHQGDVTADDLWIIDPLDGTNNFAHQVPHFAVSIAYYRRGQPVCGVVMNPLRDEWYTAVRGCGAWLNGKPVRVSEERGLNEVLVGVGFYYDRGAMMEATLSAIRELFRQQIHGIRRFGAASLDLCAVGQGLFGAFFEYRLSAWDFAAGRLFVEEAGGRVTTGHGDALPLAVTSVLASNGHLHDAMLQIVAAQHP